MENYRKMALDRRFDYHPVTRTTVLDLRRRVNELISEGYVPLGEPKLVHDKDDDGEDVLVYLQFMVSPKLAVKMSALFNHG